MGGRRAALKRSICFFFLQKFRIGLVSSALPVCSGKQWIGRGKEAGRKKFRENFSPHHLTIPVTQIFIANLYVRVHT
jgi:hypothetical protein